jgi:hypothetical protein
MTFGEKPEGGPAEGHSTLSSLRARAARTKMLLLVARIMGEWHDTLCRVSNISAGGMRAEGPTGCFSVGEAVAMELRSAHRLSGLVRWVRDGAFGIRFDERLDVDHFLSNLSSATAGPDGQRVRAPRLPTCCAVEVRADGCIYRPRMLDLSQGGARLAFETPVLALQTLLTLAIPGLPQLRGVVRWARGGECGIALLEPVGLLPLSEWLVDPAVRYAAG